MRQLTSLDAQFLAMESGRTYGHVSGLAIYDPSTAPGATLTARDVCRVVAERLHLLPPFRWKLVEVPFGLDAPYWIEDPDFDLDFHIRETAAPPPVTERRLAEQVARIVARPLDRSRPLWELYVIQGLPGGRVGMLTKIHHAVVDGVSGAEILGILLDIEPDGRQVPPAPEDWRAGGERRPGSLEMLGRGIAGLPLQPLRALRSLPQTVPSLAELPGANIVPGVATASRAAARLKGALGGAGEGELLGRAPSRVPKTLFNTRVSAHRRFAYGSVSLDCVKAIKNEAGVTVNDVVMTVCATALRAFLLERGELPDEPLVAMVPMSVRTQAEQGTFGNRVSMMLAPLPTDEPDPRTRLERTHAFMKEAKVRHRALPASILQDVTRFVPPALYTRAARGVAQISSTLRPPLNVVISNIPGPPIPLYIAGAELVAHYPVSVITDGVGLNITCMSYRDHIDFGIVADHDQVDDIEPMMEAVREALDELDEVICGRRQRFVRDPVAVS
jgi:WS/DGAT/MGAT family acyltransferase